MLRTPLINPTLPTATTPGSAEMSTVDVSRWVTAEPTSTHTLGSSYNEHLISL
jgi:hypothetical protein